MRDFEKVVEAVRNKIPEDFNPDLRVELDKCVKRATYTPPEQMHRHWKEASILLGELIGEPDDEQWKQDVQDIWTAKDHMKHFWE